MNTALNEGTYPGKILLFGEYSVIEYSDALVIPYRAVSAQLIMPEYHGSDTVLPESNKILHALVEFIARRQAASESDMEIDTADFRHDVENGMILKSTIPGKYGLGSSGALCAAVYDKYAYSKPDRYQAHISQEAYNKTRSQLASMESFFHGRSSGIDPLCSFFDRALHIQGKGTIRSAEPETERLHECNGFMIDTGLQGDTEKLVDIFGKQMQEPDRANLLRNEYIPLVNEVIRAYLEGGNCFELVMELSAMQYRLFAPMIPVEFRAVWQYGFESKAYALKLCGSGGGGMILGFTPDILAAERLIKESTGLSIIPFS